MARRSRRRLAALTLVVGLVAPACQGEEVSSTSLPSAETPTTARPEASTTTSTPATTTPPTTSTAPPSTTTEPTTDTTVEFADLPGADVQVPVGEGPFPAVVLVHGGGWVVGSIESMGSLADYLTAAGFLTVNTTYQLSLREPGFPGAVEDISCAVTYAASHPLSSGRVTVVGHSAGAHIGSLVALDAAPYDDECPGGADLGTPDAFVGLAGPYDIARLGPLMVPFFGVDAESDPALWDAGNPFTLLDRNPDLSVLLIHGDSDQVVPFDFSSDFADDLEAAGVPVRLEILAGVDHPGARSPNIVGELIADFIQVTNA